MITNTQTARTFAQSIATLAVAVQDAIDRTDWEDAEDTLSSLEDDLKRLQRYVMAKADANRAEE